MKHKTNNPLAAIALAWKDAPCSAITLRDMIEFIAARMVYNLELLNVIRNTAFVQARSDGKATLPKIDKSDFKEALRGVVKMCEELGMGKTRERALESLRRILDEGAFPAFTQQTVCSEIDAIQRLTLSEMSELTCVAISKDKSGFFKQKCLFGSAVNSAFPSARKDIAEAGNCLAFGLNSAAIFHFMRAVEIGLRALAKSLRVPIKRGEIEYMEWHSIIENIERRIEQRLNPNPQPGVPAAHRTRQKKAADREFFNGIMGEFHGFKDVWRNNIMHSRRDYSAPEALGVYLRVRDFMQRLATRVSEQR